MPRTPNDRDSPSKKVRIQTAIEQSVIALNEHGVKVGHGCIYYSANGRMRGPYLWTNDNEPMPSGIYNIKILGETLVVVPKGVH